jgi:glycosyltransferase involved in cell wall biosynthesis
LSGISLPDVLAVRLAGKRCVLTVQHPGAWHDSGPVARAKMAAVAIATDLIAVSTPSLRANLFEVVPDWLLRRRLVIVPPGVEAPRRSDGREAARRALDLPNDSVVVVTISRLTEGKGLEAAVRAMRDRVGVVHLVAGEGPLRASLEREAGPTTRILGRVPDIDRLLAAADLFVLASEMEGFGLGYVEAAMWGVPSIGCAVGGVPWVVEDGVTGLLVKPGDAAALEDAIDRLLRNKEEREAMGERALRRALSELSADAMAARYLATAARLTRRS